MPKSFAMTRTASMSWVETGASSAIAFVLGPSLRNDADKLRAAASPFWFLVKFENGVLRQVLPHCFLVGHDRNIRYRFRLVVGTADRNAYERLPLRIEYIRREKLCVCSVQKRIRRQIRTDYRYLTGERVVGTGGENDELLRNILFVSSFLRRERHPTLIVEFVRCGHPARVPMEGGKTVPRRFDETVYRFELLVR